MKLLVERQRHITYVKVGIFNYYFTRVNYYMLVFVMVFVNSFGRVTPGIWWLADVVYGAFGSSL